MKRQIAIEIICFLFMLLFVYTAISKLLDYTTFSSQLARSPLFNHFSLWKTVAPFVVWLIPVVEIMIAASLSLSRYRRIGMWSCLALMTGFTFYVLYVLIFAENVPCSCGGVLESLNWNEHLYFNLVFVGIALGGLILTRNNSIDKIAGDSERRAAARIEL